MSNYTIKNLREMNDYAAEYGYGEFQEARSGRSELDAERTGLLFMRVKPGKRQAFAHRHDDAEEVYVILSGTGRVKLDDDVVDVGPLDAIRVAPPVTRQFEADDNGLEFIAFGQHHDKDGEVAQDGFWD